MDEESRREMIFLEHGVYFRKGGAGSKDSRETSAEARPLQGRATALESEGIALLAGPRGRLKTGGGRGKGDSQSPLEFSSAFGRIG